MQNVTYRATYLQRKLQNRDRNNNPIRLEVYLDKSYVNVNHVRGMTWLSPDKKLYYDSKSVKAQLMELICAHKSPPFYMAIALATMYGHHVTYTPPYHPKLQPIELIWGR
ncbi:hypothetical protein PHMEG_00027754 [Phytophthora megakarya]|uniref:Uncharacterized protein n=1 Tax=Phytophthora megakarya TaxID=4795 RepID=A0A225V740_9STRA|nr:hypothetical protein PHMEG_00027754 [Phytophthora megakarya]